MAVSKHKPTPEELPDLSSQSDFQLLDSFARVASRQASAEMMPIIWEIMRRYTSSLAKVESRLLLSLNIASGTSGFESPKWGDCKAVEARYGLKRGVINGMIKRGEIVSSSNSEEKPGGGRTRGKLVINFESVEKHLNSRANGITSISERPESPESHQSNLKNTQ